MIMQKRHLRVPSALCCIQVCLFIAVFPVFALENLTGIVVSVDRTSGSILVEPFGQDRLKKTVQIEITALPSDIPPCVIPGERIYVWGSTAAGSSGRFIAKFIRGKHWNGNHDPTGARLRIGKRCASKACCRNK